MLSKKKDAVKYEEYFPIIFHRNCLIQIISNNNFATLLTKAYNDVITVGTVPELGIVAR